VVYLREVEPIRLAVNRLLEAADPILSGYRSGRLSPRHASGWRTGLGVLARRVALTLPGDLQVAGRGEVAPSPAGS